jgi:type I restriction enzyme S subunit
LFVKHIVGGTICFEETKYISQTTYEELHRRTPVEVGDILYSAVGSYGVAVPVLTQQPFSFQRHIAHIKPHPALNQRYLVYYLNSQFGMSQAHRAARGVAQKTVTLGDLRKFEVRLAPLQEQSRIVAKIEELLSDLDAGVAALVRARAKLARYRAAVLGAAGTGALTEEWRVAHPAAEPASVLLARILAERRHRWEADQLGRFKAAGKKPPSDWQNKYVEPTQPDTTALPELPAGWCWATVEQLLSEPTCNGISVKGRDEPPGVPALRLSAMSGTGFDYSDRRYIPISGDVATELQVRESDFFISRGNGSLRLVGRGTLAQEPPELIVFPDTMIRMRFGGLQDTRRFINLIWQSQFIRRQVEKKARTTAGIYKISQQDAHEFVLPLPPATEQQEVIAEAERRLSVNTAAEAQIAANLQRAARLRQSILKEAFSGRLVPQDPNDEPATALLERIKQERAALPAHPNGQTRRRKQRTTEGGR